MYESALQLAEERQKVHYAKTIVEGVSFHLQQRYDEAATKFYEAHHIQPTVESLFLSSISLVQKFKSFREKQGELFIRIEEMLAVGRKL
jgi:predicted HNH restriction endonuclease